MPLANASIMTTGKPSMKLGSTIARACKQVFFYILARRPASNSHSIRQSRVNNCCLDFRSHLAVADQSETKIDPLFHESCRCGPAKVGLFPGRASLHKPILAQRAELAGFMERYSFPTAQRTKASFPHCDGWIRRISWLPTKRATTATNSARSTFLS